MTRLEQDLLQTLEDLDRAAKAMATASPKPDLQPLFRRLDELAARLPEDAPRDLAHYLQRRSYEKARLLLLGRAAENARGACADH
jgi:hypothetical protein